MDILDLRAFETDTAKLVPGFQLAWKDKDRTQQFIGWLAKLFNPDYLTKYTSTFSPKVYFPSQARYEANPTSSFRTLAHERVHLLDTTWWFRISYILPQVLALPLLLCGAVLAFFVGWWALVPVVLGLACVAPWPSPWRVHWERRGYAMSLAIRFWMIGDIGVEAKEGVAGQFTKSSYYFMSWSKAETAKWVAEVEVAIRNGTLVEDETYGSVYRFLKSRNLVHSAALRSDDA